MNLASREGDQCLFRMSHRMRQAVSAYLELGREMGRGPAVASRHSAEALPPGAADATPLSWAVAVCDDYDDATPRVVLTIEEIGNPGAGLVAHLDPDHARRLRGAIHDALREIGEATGR